MKRNKIVRRNRYAALVSETKYQQMQTSAFLEKTYEGDAKEIARLLIPFAPEINLMNTLLQHFDHTMTQVRENHRIEQNHPTSSTDWNKSNL